MSDLKHVFIVGCPRSGSTWTTFLMSHHPQVATFQHAKVFDYLAWMDRWWRNKAHFKARGVSNWAPKLVLTINRYTEPPPAPPAIWMA